MSVRYTFGEFVLSPSRRLLLQAGREISLVPRYFDLLLLLIRGRDRVIGRDEILKVVWHDVIVADGALSQAVRTLRRTLGDDPRNAMYIRTVSRHGYQFISRVVEGDDGVPLPSSDGAPSARGASDFSQVFAQLLSDAPEEVRRMAAETLHGLDTSQAVARLRETRGAARARALLRDARWNLPHADPVPILGQPEAIRTLLALCSLRLRRVLGTAGSRFTAAVMGAMAAGFLAGFVGALVLYLPPSSSATSTVIGVLPLVGAVIAGLGAAGVAAGMCCAEVLTRSRRGLALVLSGAAGGGLIGVTAHGAGRMALQGLFGQDLSPVAGGFEGLVIGAATGFGYALATPLAGGGLAAPRGRARWSAAFMAGVSCAAAAALLSATGSYLGAMSLDLLAQRFPGSQVSLDPLARLLGEASPGPVTRIAIGAWEGLLFASGTVIGLTHRPRRHDPSFPD